MSFAQTLDVLLGWVVDNLPVVIGGGVAIVVLSILFVMNRKRRVTGLNLEKLAALSNNPNALQEEKALNWTPPEQSYADRRETVRREGAPVRVLLASPTFRNGIGDGYVLDRSTGGLRVAMSIAMPPGSTMQVRAVNAPDTIGFVTVIIRSCRKNDDFFEIGCEFDKTPPWNVLLLFG
jgi:hypothetical protein